jgi:large subunit ribosomal protein L31
MKTGIHPESHDTTITCTCGAVYHTKSTVKNIRIGICAACHPFFTGEQRFIDTAGRVDKFSQRYGSTNATRRAAPKREPIAARQKAPPKEKKPYTPKPEAETAPAEEAPASA